MARFEKLFESTAFDKVTDLEKESASRGGEMGKRFSVAIGRKWKRDSHRKASNRKRLTTLDPSTRSTSVLPGWVLFSGATSGRDAAVLCCLSLSLSCLSLSSAFVSI